jgi:hypothetical protein
MSICFARTEWPFNPAMRLECHMTKAPRRAKLYIYRNETNPTSWNYCFSAGANSERSHSGCVHGCVDPNDAGLAAIESCKRMHVWDS